jgi:ketosteroid isomerase-like protein
MDSMDVLLGFFDAINANDLDTAMTLVQDDVIMTAGSTTIIGKADLKTYLQKQAAQNVTYTASNLDSTGDIVNFTLQAGDNAPAVDGDTAIMVDGELQTLTLH